MADGSDLRPQLDPVGEADEGFRTLVDALPDAILVHSQDRIVFVNPCCMRLLGAERPDQLLGRDVYEIIHPDFRANIGRRIQDCYDRKATNPPMENILLKLDGSSIPTEATAIFITWKGSPAIEVVLRDISQRKRAEKRLQEYERVVEVVGDMIVVVDREYRYVIANRAFLKYRGMESEDVIGHLVSDVLNKGVFETVVKERLDECFRGKVVKYELRYKYPQLGQRDLFLSYFPIESAGEVIAAACVLQDITERKQLEQADREWHKRLELAEQAGLGIGLWDWDIASNTVIWSDETYRQFGYTRNTFSGRVEDAFQRIHPEDQPRVTAAIHNVLEGNAEYAAQYRVVRPDGSTCWIDAHGVVLRAESTRMLGVGIDITSLKKTEQAFQESEEKYLLLLNSTAEAIYGVDLQGNCTFCNPACLRLLGHQAPEALLGKNMHEVMHHSRIDGTPYPLQECNIYVAFRQGRHSHVTDEVLWRADGTNFLAEYWSYPMRKGDEIIGCVVTFLDISERQRTEQALRQSEEKYRELFENAPYGIFRSSSDGTLLDVNPAFVAMLGYGSKAELMSRNLERDIYLDPAERTAIIEECRLKGRLDGMEAKWKRKDGKMIDVRMSGRMIAGGTENTGNMEVIADDITVRRILEQELRQAQKMEAVGRLAGGVAHDFNNLLMVMRSYTEMLQDNLPADDALRKNTREIMKAADRAASLIGQMLAFSRKQILSPAVLDLNAAIDETAKMMRRLIGEDIDFEVNLAEPLWAIEADSDQIVQVLMNLCVNARDAMPQGGTLTIATENVTVEEGSDVGHSYVSPGAYVKMSVTDTGMGISKALQEQIFEPFFTTKEVGKGTGLGLATVYGIVKQSGGYVWAESELGQGTCFTVFLPRVTGAVVLDTSANAEAPLRGKETILVAEDEEALREAICDFLRSLEYTILAAGSGQQALSIASQYEGNIDLLITDLVMPKMSGRELAQRLGSQHSSLKTIYMSGYTDDTVFRHGTRDLAAAFLQKPFSLSTLSRKVRETLGPIETAQ
jgi:PAS domain S-box-containing protein